jgi:hypothetical protein
VWFHVVIPGLAWSRHIVSARGGNPLADITNTRHVQLAMKSGFISDRHALLAMTIQHVS